MGKSITRLDYRGGQQLDALIRAHCDVDERGGRSRVRYHAGWDDQRVTDELAAKLGLALSMSTIRRFRRKYVGETHGGGRGADANGALAPILTVAVQARGLALEAQQRLDRHEVLLRALCKKASLTEGLDYEMLPTPAMEAEDDMDEAGEDEARR